ncbi:MAG: hypothetical protein KGK09_02845 [Burkholderiales bacterium]|nr:hypothetical protein [Burkholderiales bacterium]
MHWRGAIHTLREAVAEAENPVMPPLPLLHDGTCWKFRAMHAMRERATDSTLPRCAAPRSPRPGCCIASSKKYRRLKF